MPPFDAMDCRFSPALTARPLLSSSSSLSQGLGLGFGTNASVRIPAKPAQLALCIRSALQEEEGKKHVQVLNTTTVFKVAGVAATIAALIFTLPTTGPRRGKAHEKAPTKESEKLKDSETGKRRSKTTTKIAPMPLEERFQWTQGLPLVKEKIAYTDVLDLHQEGKVKHIIKHPLPALKNRPQVVFVVLDDDRVVRAMLPSLDRDQRFWSCWKEMKLESSVMNAFTPPPPVPEAPWKEINLPFWSQVDTKTMKKEQPKQQKRKQGPTPRVQKSAVSARIEQLEKARKDLERARTTRDAQLKNQKLQQIQAEKDEKTRALQQKEMAEKKKKLAEAKQAKSEKLVQQQLAARTWDNFWYSASRSEGFRFVLGLFFFWLFYQTVVLGVKKRRKDYEDRLKIEKAEEEERKKMEEWEDELDTAEATTTTEAWKTDIASDEEKRRKDEVEQNPQVQMGLRFMRSGARVRRARGKRPPRYLDLGADVKFEDVAGLGDIRKELEEIVDFFTYKEKYLRRGSKIPSGILLCGEPGTGKTLLAKAVAGEAGVNFFSISASQFVEIYVGVGASRVRALYQEARENAPAVVFIDELDAVGRQRGLIGGSGGQERDATLNQLLTCLDGFEGKGDVITIAATNRVDILDSALVRPGRFDRKIYIPKPGARGRAEILSVHAKNKPMADDIDFNAVADVTDGMVGAQLANLLDVAALNVLRDGRTEITTDDLLDAAQLEEGGHPDPRPRSEELWHKMALNEASMAVAAANFPDFNNIQLLTIIPRMGEDKGAVRVQMDYIKFETSSLSRQGVMDYITLQLAPRAADEIWFGCEQMCTIWADQYNQARKVARYYVFCGLSDCKDIYGMFHCWSELERYYEVDVEAKKILEACYSRAMKIMEKNQVLVKELVNILLDTKVVKKEQFWKLVEQHGSFEEFRPHLVDIRNKKLEEFREQMFGKKKAAQLPS